VHDLTRHDRLPLRPVLLQVLGEVEIIDEFVDAAQSKQQFGCDVDADVDALGDQGKLQAKLIPKELELLFLYAFILFYDARHVFHLLIIENIVQLIFVPRCLIIIITVRRRLI